MWIFIYAMTGQHTGKTVAIIVGGAAGVAFLIICLLFARNLMKKRDGRLLYMWHYGIDDLIYFSVNIHS